jgi:AcrR family transcriptional regulator
MTKQVASPTALGEALALREAGYTALAISQRLGVSVRTLQRHFASSGARKGALKAEVLQRAKEQLMSRITSDEVIKEEAARLVADDLAHSLHLREIILAASQQMKATNLAEAALVMRAAAAYSTVMKNTSDVLRHSLRLEQRDNGSDELPELIVSELTTKEIERLRSTDECDEQAHADDDVNEVIELA